MSSDHTWCLLLSDLITFPVLVCNKLSKTVARDARVLPQTWYLTATGPHLFQSQ